MSGGNIGDGGGSDPAAAAAAAAAVPEQVRHFLALFYAKFKQGDCDEMHTLYEKAFAKLGKQFYASSSWPTPDTVAHLLREHRVVASGTSALSSAALAAVEAGAAAVVENETGTTHKVADGSSNVRNGDGGDADANDNTLSTFLVLYKELCFRHVHMHLSPTLMQRFEAWENYLDLFDRVLDGTMLDFDLPASWIWDITDEFIFQLEACCQYRERGTRNRTDEEEAYLRDAGAGMWDVKTVLQYLHALVNRSNVCEWLMNGNQPAGSSDRADADAFDFASRPLYRFFGYFSVVSLLRVHCMLGDYRLALMVLQPIDFDADSSGALFTRVTACHISMYYYMGFAYFMLRRYHDAIRVFSSTLMHIGRIKQYHTRSYQYEQVNKRSNQMMTLIVLAQGLCHARVDETLNAKLREKFSDKTARMRAGDESAFAELFAFVCPHFLTLAPAYSATGDGDGGGDHGDRQETRIASTTIHDSAARVQTRVFLNEVRQHLALPLVRSYLRLYRTIDLRKLAELLNSATSRATAAGDENDDVVAAAAARSASATAGDAKYTVASVRALLLRLKHKAWTVRHANTDSGSGNGGAGGTAPLDGEFTASPGDVDFFIDDDVVRVVDSRVEHRLGEHFVRNVGRLGDQAAMLQRIQRERLASTAAANARKEETRRRREEAVRREEEERERQRREREAREAREAREREAAVSTPKAPMSLAERLRSRNG